MLPTGTIPKKLQEIYLVLHDRDIIASIVKTNWNAVKNEFLASYEPRNTAKITCANFTELTQCQDEGVHDYYLWVHHAISKMCEAKPANIATLQVIPANIVALVPAVAPVDLSACKTEGICDTEKFFNYWLFLARLNKPILGKKWKQT